MACSRLRQQARVFVGLLSLQKAWRVGGREIYPGRFMSVNNTQVKMSSRSGGLLRRSKHLDAKAG